MSIIMVNLINVKIMMGITMKSIIIMVIIILLRRNVIIIMITKDNNNTNNTIMIIIMIIIINISIVKKLEKNLANMKSSLNKL